MQVIETHFAWVFLGGSRAFKLKKPVRQASMDYRTLARRESACRAELRLNRRLAPDVYLRVVPLRCGPDGTLSRRGGTRVIDWLVEMRRLPERRRLDRLLAEGTLRASDFEELLVRLASFFRCAESRPMTDRGYLARLRGQILDNARELDAPDLALRHRQVAALARAQLDFLARNARLFRGRGARLIEGHGDLRPEHVFLGSRSSAVCVIDCLEFDPDLRRLDPAEEIAFLALECARLAGARTAAELIARYRRVTADPPAPALMEFYMSRRAAVRAQISAWHLRDKAFAAQRSLWRTRAYSYLADARRLCRSASSLARLRSGPPPRAGRATASVIPREAEAIAPGAAPRPRRRPSAVPPRQIAGRPAT